MSTFVQFLHPGAEHGPDHRSKETKGWNYGPHKRKFIQASGSWTPNPGAKPRLGNFSFWGEWEAQSIVTLVDRDGGGRGPRWIHKPNYDGSVLASKPPRDEWQNTDPNVFGKHFLYSICRQFNPGSGSPTKLGKLDVGDVVLFGSHVDGQFALDTAFVVSSFVAIAPDGVSPPWVSPLYQSVTFDRIQFPACGARLYRGAGWKSGNPFSFVPCLPFETAPKGFPRPIIRPTGALKGLITPSMKQNFKATTLDSGTNLAEVWKAVAEQVRFQGCSLATKIDEPKATVASLRRPTQSTRQKVC